MKNTDIPTVIYSVTELKATFSKLAIDRMLASQSEPLTKDGISLFDTSPKQRLAMEAAIAVGAISQFCNAEFIGLKAVPAELATEADQADQPFYKAYRLNDFILMTADQADQFPAAIRKLG